MISRDDTQRRDDHQPNADEAYKCFPGTNKPMTPEALGASEKFYDRYGGTNCSVLGELSPPKPSGEESS